LEVLINSIVAKAQLDLSFLDDPLDVAMSGYRTLEVPVLSDRKTWSSLAAVLFLHAALTCILWVSPKAHPDSHKWIEVQLVSVQGCADATGSDLHGGLEAGGGDQSATSAAPANQELPTRI